MRVSIYKNKALYWAGLIVLATYQINVSPFLKPAQARSIPYSYLQLFVYDTTNPTASLSATDKDDGPCIDCE